MQKSVEEKENFKFMSHQSEEFFLWMSECWGCNESLSDVVSYGRDSGKKFWVVKHEYFTGGFLCEFWLKILVKFYGKRSQKFYWKTFEVLIENFWSFCTIFYCKIFIEIWLKLLQFFRKILCKIGLKILVKKIAKFYYKNIWSFSLNLNCEFFIKI